MAKNWECLCHQIVSLTGVYVSVKMAPAGPHSSLNYNDAGDLWEIKSKDRWFQCWFSASVVSVRTEAPSISYHSLHFRCCHSLCHLEVQRWLPQLPASFLKLHSQAGKKRGKKASFPKPFFMDFSSMITVGNTSQKLLASITCLDHITNCHYKSLGREHVLAKGTGSNSCGKKCASLNIWRAQGKSTKL